MYQEFQAFRGTQGNVVFPDTIIIEDDTVTLYKQGILNHTNVVISRRSIASVHCRYGVVFCDIVIETSGGQHYTLNGFLRSDASQIECLLA